MNIETISNASSEHPISITSIRPLNKKGFPIDIGGNGININRGNCTTIIGPNGCGKTTLLEALLRIRLDYDISAKILGHDCKKLPEKLRFKIGASLQFQGFPGTITVRDIVQLHSGVLGQPKNQKLLDELRLTQILKNKYSRTSGGQKKRVALYYALAHTPDLCILDEPDTGLDSQGIEALQKIILERKRNNDTTVIVTHNPKILGFADSVLYMVNGMVNFSGEKQVFLTHELGEFVLEIERGAMTKNLQRSVRELGIEILEDNLEFQRYLIFCNREHMEKIKTQFQSELQYSSIIRKTRDNDINTWINASRRKLEDLDNSNKPNVA